MHEAIPATLEGQRARIEADWREAQAELSVLDQLSSIRSSYQVRREDLG